MGNGKVSGLHAGAFHLPVRAQFRSSGGVLLVPPIPPLWKT